MHAIVLAAGQGTRLRNRAPVKPLAAIGGRSLLHHVLDSLAAGGATSASVVTGFEADTVAAEARRHRLVPEVVPNPDFARAPNGVSLLAARHAVTGPTLLAMADHLLSAKLVRRLLSGARAPLALAVDRRLGHPGVDEADVTRVRTRGARIEAIGKQLAVYDCYDTGLFVISPALIDSLQTLAAPSLSEGVQQLADAGRAQAVDIGDAEWLDVDDARAMEMAEAVWRPAA